MIRALSIATVACIAAVASLAVGSGTAHGACLAIPAPGEVDFGTVRQGDDKKIPVAVENKCGEKVKIKSTAFISDGDILLVKNKCIDEEPPDKGTCSLEFTFEPELKDGKQTGKMSLKYVGAKVKEDTFSFELKGNGIRRKLFNKGGAFSGAGELTTETATGFDISCAVSGGGEANAEENGEPSGEFASVGFSGCSTNLPGCSVTSSTAKSLPWTMEAFAEEAVYRLEVQNLEVVTKLGSGCLLYGLPSETTAIGSVIGTFDNPTSCLEFSESPGLTVQGSIAATLSGEVCVTEPEGLELE